MLLTPPDRERGFKRERLLRILLTHPDGSLTKRALAEKAATSDAWAAKFTNQLEKQRLVEETTVRDPHGLYAYWQNTRIPPTTLTVSFQDPLEQIQTTTLTYAATTYQAETARQGFLFPSTTALYIHPEETEEWSSLIENQGLIGGGNTELRVLDSHVFDGATTVNGLTTVCIPQLIVDLLDEGGPCVEAAKRLIETYHE